MADTGAEFRRSLVRTLNDEPGLRVVGETGDGPELLRMARELQPFVKCGPIVPAGSLRPFKKRHCHPVSRSNCGEL